MRITKLQTRALGHQIFITCCGQKWGAASIPPEGRHQVRAQGGSLHEVLKKMVSGIFWDRYPFTDPRNYVHSPTERVKYVPKPYSQP